MANLNDLMRVGRTVLVLGTVLMLSASASAQRVDHSNLRLAPTAKVRRPGTWVAAEGRWVRPRAKYGPLFGVPGSTTVFNNTCMWAGNAPNTISFIGVDACSDVYSQGNIPSTTNPLDLSGLATDDNQIVGLTVGYATFTPPGTQSIEYTFWDNLGGTCVGFTSPTPPEPPAAGTLELSPASPLIAPADPTGGSGTLWIFTIDVTGTAESFCLLSDGDGTFSGLGSAADQFNWRYRHSNLSSVIGSSGEGPILAGDPMFVGAAGTLTYSTPGVPQLVTAFTQPCGTGRGTSDSFWLNTNLTMPCTTTGTTGCFGFGYPGAIYGSYYMSLGSSGACAGDPMILTYCTGKTTSQGCIPFIVTAGGTPSVAGSDAFNIQGHDHALGQAGLLVYGFKKANLSFHGGKLCIKAPITRTAAKASKSKPPTNCVPSLLEGSWSGQQVGRLVNNFNKRIRGTTGGGFLGTPLDPLLTAGQTVFAQWQQRDPTNSVGAFGDNLSNGVRFTILP